MRGPWSKSRRRSALLPALLALVSTSSGCGDRPGDHVPADLVMLGGAIYTMDEARSRASAVAVADGRIVHVGSDDAARRWIGPGTEVVELAGRMVLPGFHDAHVHLLTGGVELGDCDLNEMSSAEEVLAGIAECAEKDRSSEWLRGGGFQLPQFPAGKPTAALLDSVVPDRPAFFSSADGHSAWVNSAALRLAGITAATPDPPLGRIERDPSTGEPLGTLRESAMELVARHLPRRSAEELVDGLRRGLALASGFGITAIHEASADADMVEAYAALASAGELTARASLSLWVDPARGLEQLPELVALRERYQRDGLRVGTVKLFVDGVIEGQTAALLEPYLGLGDFAGELNFEPSALAELVTAFDGEGFQIHAHAIGDRAIRVTLDALEHADRINGTRDARHHLAHIQLFDPEDIPRVRELEVFANFQPLWAYRDAYIVELTEPFLGPRRSRWLYPIGSMVASGARVVFGSDWSVSSMNPLLGIQVGITRQDPSDTDSPVWIPEERVSLETMLAGYTIDAARLDFLETDSGSIEPGKVADLVVLDRDLFAVGPSQIGDARVLLTLLGGQPIYRDADL